MGERDGQLLRRLVAGAPGAGCLEVIEWVLAAGRFPADPGILAGGVLIPDTSEELIPARNVRWIVRALGERGILAAVDAVLVARPPVSTSPAARPPGNGPGRGPSNATSWSA